MVGKNLLNSIEVTSLALLERARAWVWVKAPPSSQEGDRGVEKIMITIRIEPPLLTGSFDTVVTVDTKVNMLMAANIWGYDLSKSWRKDEIARSKSYGHL